MHYLVHTKKATADSSTDKGKEPQPPEGCLISDVTQEVFEHFFFAWPLNWADACIVRSGVKCENRQILVYQRF